MTKAEEASLLAYPVKMGLFYEPDHHYEADKNMASRIKFQEGYEQAEKDLALTWEDVLKISELLKDVRYEFRNAGSYDDIPWYTGDGKSEYEEVLKRFNNQRNGRSNSQEMS